MRVVAYILMTVALFGLFQTVNAELLSNTDLRGTIGLDLEQFGFSSSRNDTTKTLEVGRTQSRHKLALSLTGPFVSDHFAHYAASAETYGTYYSVRTGNDKKSLFLDPKVRNYHGVLTLFPNRRFPVKLYRSKSEDVLLRYESGNRSDVELLQPELAVVRRYEGERISQGGAIRGSLSKHVSFTSELKHNETKTARKYDFDENRDIWVEITNFLINELKEVDTIQVYNLLPDAAVRVLVDFELDVTIDPGDNALIAVDSGYHEINLIPLTYYNEMRFRTDIRSNAIWKIVYNEPATPKDVSQEDDIVSLSLNIGGEGSFRNESLYEFSNSKEFNQNLSSDLSNFSNSLAYGLSKSVDLLFLTTMTSNETSVDTLPAQLSKSFVHSSTLSKKNRLGLSSTLSHSYNKNSSVSDVQDLSSNTNIFVARAEYVSKRLNHRIGMKNSASLLSDNTQYQNNLYSTDVTNDIQFPYFGVKWQPRHQLKYSINNQRNPNQHSTELETKFALIGDISKTRLFGDLTFKGEYNYRRKSLGDGIPDVRKKLLFDFTVMKRFGARNRLMLLTIQENESFGPLPGRGGSKVVTKPSEYKASYKADLQLSPADGFLMTGSYMFISQKTATINKFGFSLNATLPIVHIPVKSYLLTEIRSLKGMPKQVQTSSETKLNYRFRQVTLVLTHSFIREKLVNDTFSFHEIRAEVSRAFSLF